MPVVSLPDGREVEFPDGTSTEVMERALRQFATPSTDARVAGNSFIRGLSSAAGMAADIVDLPRRGIAAGVDAIFGRPEDGARADRRIPPPEALGAVGRVVGPAGGAGPLSGENIQRNLREAEILDGAGTAPQNTRQRYIGAAAEGAGGGLVFGPASAVLGAIGGGVGEGAAEAAQAAGASPLVEAGARVAGNLAGGVGGAMAGRAAGRVIAPVRGNPNPERAALVQAAEAEGIPLTPAQRSGSRPLATMESTFASLPLTAAREAEMRGAQQAAFNQAALQRAGVQGQAATPDVLADAQRSIGQRIGDIAARNDAAYTPPLVQRLQALANEAEQFAAPDVRHVVQNRIAQVVDAIEPSNTTPGRTWRELDSAIGAQLQGATGDLRNYLVQLRTIARDALEAGAGPAEAGALQAARREYRNLITLQEAMGMRGQGAPVGDISPTSLRAAATAAEGRRGYSSGRGDFNELSRVGAEIVRNQIPNSGTSERTIMANLLTAGGTGGMAAMAGASPSLTALAAGSALLPRAIQGAYYSRPGMAYMAPPEGLRAAVVNALARPTREGAAAGAVNSATGDDEAALRRAIAARLLLAE